MIPALPRTAAETALGVTLPHRRMEDWRWTDLRQLINRPYPAGVVVKPGKRDAPRIAATSPFAEVIRARFIFVNGRYNGMISRTPTNRGVVFSSERTPVPMDADPLVAMNAALADDGASLVITGNTDKPIELVFVTTSDVPRAVATRNRIVLEPGASATIVETHLGEGEYLANSLTQIELGDGARLDRIKLELESAEAIHLAHCFVTLGHGALLRDLTFTTGARLNRQNGTIRFAGEHGDAKINGAYLIAGKQHADTRLLVDHAVPRCTSREMFKCVMDGEARGIFQGKVHVAKQAQKTDGKQSSHALLLSETAEFDAKPELEIYADDVVCGHGATAGDLDHDHVFYLKSRGIPEAEAKAMLVSAFVAEAFDNIEHEGIKEALTALVEARLSRTP